VSKSLRVEIAVYMVSDPSFLVLGKTLLNGSGSVMMVVHLLTSGAVRHSESVLLMGLLKLSSEFELKSELVVEICSGANPIRRPVRVQV